MNGLIGHAGLLLNGLWSPAQLTDPLKIWLDDTSAVTNVSGLASQWSDRSGSGLHFSQGTAGNRPAILAAALNGRRVLRANGTSSFMTCGVSGYSAIFQAQAAGWMLAVVKKSAVDASALDRTLFRVNSSGSGSRFAAQIGTSIGGANKPELGVRRLDSDGFSALSAAAPGTSWRILMFVQNWSTGAGSIYMDGSLSASNSSLTTSGITSNTGSSTPLVLFRDSPTVATRHLDADVAAVLVGNGAVPSSSDRERLEGWAAWRYGLQANLPIGHPYESSPP